MTLHDEFQDGAEQYARILDERRETERLAALRLEAQHLTNASAFAAAIGGAFTNNTLDDTDTDTQEI